MGIEPMSEAWEASILPLYDARSFLLARLYITAGPREKGCALGRQLGAAARLTHSHRIELERIQS
jgi:hypothetical protein